MCASAVVLTRHTQYVSGDGHKESKQKMGWRCVCKSLQTRCPFTFQARGEAHRLSVPRLAFPSQVLFVQHESIVSEVIGGCPWGAGKAVLDGGRPHHLQQLVEPIEWDIDGGRKA